MPKGLRLQLRDITLLDELGLVGLLDTETIHARHFPKDKHGTYCRRRLQLYHHHGLTQQVHRSITSTTRPGRIPMVHRLTPAGAELVEHETGVCPPQFARSKEPKEHTIQHRLGVAKIMLAVNDACKLHALQKPEWILDYDVDHGVPIGAPKAQRFRLYKEFSGRDGKRVALSPDAASLLYLPVTTPAGEKTQHGLALYWEYDRSTETHSQIIEQKLPGYDALLGHGAYRKLWPPAQAVRVLFVVQSEQRLANLSATLLRQPDANAYYRLAVARNIDARHVLAGKIWRTPGGDHRQILG